ncbi:MAG: nucleoside phosphorylase [Firmicutes bacterium]|nr:nucleoside phosphorylase [Bacillota bacterium]
MKDIPITEFFDDEPLITPSKLAGGLAQNDFLKTRDKVQSLGIKTAIITFLNKDVKEVAEIVKGCEMIHWVYGRSSGRVPVFVYDQREQGKFSTEDFRYNGVLLVFTCVGAPVAAAVIEELAYFGVENFLAYGTAGCLVKGFDTKKMFIIDRAIRDEGTSYHYLPADTFVEPDPKISECIERVFKRHKIKYDRGTIWTTDALYRETGKRVERRVSQGAKAVDMEASAFCAVAKKLGVRFGEFVFFSDKICDDGKWDWMHKMGAGGDLKAKLIPLAIEIAKEIK